MISAWRQPKTSLAVSLLGNWHHNGSLEVPSVCTSLHACKLHRGSLLDALSLESTPEATQSDLEVGGVFAPLREGLEGRALLQPVTPTTTLSAGDPLALLNMILDHLRCFLNGLRAFLDLFLGELEVRCLLRIWLNVVSIIHLRLKKLML